MTRSLTSRAGKRFLLRSFDMTWKKKNRAWTTLIADTWFWCWWSLTPSEWNQQLPAINREGSKQQTKMMSRAATSTQCYKHFTGLHLQVCKYRAIFKITFSPKYCQIKCGYDRTATDFCIKKWNQKWTNWYWHYLLLHVILKIGLF